MQVREGPTAKNESLSPAQRDLFTVTHILMAQVSVHELHGVLYPYRAWGCLHKMLFQQKY